MAEVSAPRLGTIRFIGIDWDFGALRQSSWRYWTFVSILGVFLALGVVAWFLLFTQGGEVLNMRDSSPWGLWFVNYMYYVGLSAGGLAVYASVHLFGAYQFAPLSRIAVLQAGVLVMLALLGIVTDMEQPWRAVGFITSPNPTSPFIYTASAANLYMILCFVDLWILITGKGGHKLAHTMTLIALPAAIYLHTTTAFVLSLNKSRELWHTAVMVPIFLTSATASGIALLLCFAYALKRFAKFKFKPSMFRALSTFLVTVIIVDLFLLVVEIITTFWPTSAKPGHVVRLEEFITGRWAWTLLPVFIIGLLTVVLLLGRRTRHIAWIQVTASALYVAAIFLKRYALLAMGFSINNLGQPVPMYFPSPVEVFLALGLIAMGLLIITIAVKILPLQVPEDQLHEHEEEEVYVEAMEKTAAADAALEGGSAT